MKAEKGYKADPGVLKQLKVIKEVFDQCDRIIVATDAGREGELIFRYIFHYLNCRKPFVRLWISSLTDKAIREGLDNLQPGEHYDNLYLSAKSRSEADWLIGINATQALSVAAGQGVARPVVDQVAQQHQHVGREPFGRIAEEAQAVQRTVQVGSDEQTHGRP